MSKNGNSFSMSHSSPTHVVCIHGCLGSTQEFGPLRYHLEHHGISTSAIPLLGHPGHPQGYKFLDVSAEAITLDLLTQLHALPLDKPIVLIGHSLGGLLALGHAADLVNHGIRLLGIATLGTPYDVAWTVNQPMGWLTQRSVPHLFKAIRYVPDSMRTLSDPTAIVRSIRQYRRLRSETEWMFQWLQARLPHVTVPVHLCHGQYDLTVPCEALDKLKAGLTGSPRVTTSALKDFGHQVYPKSRAAQAVTLDLLNFVQAVLSWQQVPA
jgi:pimeloyl-ACP methyl ester carboxylesterase